MYYLLASSTKSHFSFPQLPHVNWPPQTKWSTYWNHISTNEPWPIKPPLSGNPSCSTSLQSFIAYWNTSKTHQALYSSVFFPTHIVQCNLLLLSTQSTNSCHDVHAPGWWCFKMLFISFCFCSFFLAPWWMSWVWSVSRHRSLRLIFMLKHAAKKEGLVHRVKLKIPSQPNHLRLWRHGVSTCCRTKGLLFGKYRCFLSACVPSKLTTGMAN